MRLVSTQSAATSVSPLEAVLKGIADDGGLFVPEIFPSIGENQIKNLIGKTYPEVAAYVLACYFDIREETLLGITMDAYANFDDKKVVPMVKLGDHEYVMELFHGPTLAFKDMALQVLPRLMTEAIRSQPSAKDVLILTATSGDTGKAALEGFSGVDHTRIAVFYPDGGVSDMQRLQMTTTKGDNTHVIAVRGNFDDAQTGVKRLFADKDFNARIADKGYVLSSANSINFGRLAPQIAYYFFGYTQLVSAGAVKLGDKINITVPTGNFGNILAAYYAKRMGLPVGKLICASNKNNVLTDFFDSGRYVVTNRTFFRTMSPSMDILISSNLERLLFELMGRDSMKVAETMKRLKFSGEYVLDMSMVTDMKSEFYADFCDDQRTTSTIRNIFNRYDYLMDPHTAVAQCVYEDYVKYAADDTPTLLVSTASPYKFVQDVLHALTGKRESDPFVAAKEVSRISETVLPKQIVELETAEILHKTVIEKEDMGKSIEDLLR